MHKSAFSAALRAAAKVAFGTSLVGCGANVAFGDLDSDEETYGEAGGSAEGEAGGSAHSEGGGYDAPPTPVDPPAPQVCEAPVPADPNGGWETYDESTFACCVERIAAVIPNDPPEQWEWEGDDQSSRECCRQILAPNYDAIWQGQPLPYPAAEEVVTACCIAAHGNAGCTPWGPPVPPAIDPEEFMPWVDEMMNLMRAPSHLRYAEVA